MAVNIRINGEDFLFNQDSRPMSEALALEEATGQPYGEWEQQLQAGSARALCAFVWLVWRRHGREVDLADILSGKIEVDLGELMDSLAEIAKNEEGNRLDPTLADLPLAAAHPHLDLSATTPRATSPRSRRSTTSAPGSLAS